MDKNELVNKIRGIEEYMKALEKASVEGDISEFTKVIASLVK